MSLIATRQCELLDIQIHDTEWAMGEAAALDAAGALKEVLAQKPEANVLFAAAFSQRAFLDTLVSLPGIDWRRVNAFHIDEYAGLNWQDEKSLAWFLESKYFSRIQLKNKFYIDGKAADRSAECSWYQTLLKQHPADLAFLGIGDNGHLAFNDPHDTRFSEREDVRIICIDDVSRRQQVNAGNFAAMQDVPGVAYTVTIPALMRAGRLFVMAPTAAKAWAAGRAVNGELSEACPASILRRHGNATLYLDRDSAKELMKG